MPVSKWYQAVTDVPGVISIRALLRSCRMTKRTTSARRKGV